MNFTFEYIAKYKVQHIIEMNADIRCKPSRFLIETLPGTHIPLSTRCHVGQFNIKNLVIWRGLDLIPQSQNGGVKPQLQNRANSGTVGLFISYHGT